MAEPSTYQSLYRRYRSQRFDQVLGQDHVTRALRNAVRDGRVGHAYLFSGPRGTGKTSTARILAKVLNCAAPQDGEPCETCDNCLTVERGQDTDWLLEQDAASKSKVDDMRDLLDRVPLGTSGNRKVIILDEVHMLSQGAENALLKTLEEPPSHVVFILATTDPQKVRPTIRSRTQHFEFHLLTADVLADHVRHVIDDAALPLDPDGVARVVDYVVQAGGGSARDTLSALDQVAALGEVLDDTQPVDAILDAVVAHDAGAVLVAVAEAMATGREPRTLGEALMARLRDSFLMLMGAGDTQLPPAAQERALQVGEAFGPARLTRALEVLGEALTELARKPDPRIVVEVALVRLARPETDASVEALAARLDRLERAFHSGQVPAAVPPPEPEQVPAPGQAPSAAVPPPESEQDSSARPSRPATSSPPVEGPASAARAALAQERGGATPEAATPQAPPGGKQTLGALARNQSAATPAGPPVEPPPASPPSSAPAADPATDPGPAPAPAPPAVQAEPVPDEAPTPAAVQPGSEKEVPDLAALLSAWNDTILGALPISVRSKWRGGAWQDVTPGSARFAVPNEWHKKACEEGRNEVQQALVQHFGVQVAVEVVVEGGGDAGRGPNGAPRSADAPAGGRTTGAASNPGNGPASLVAEEEAGGAEHVDMANFAELADAGDMATGGVEFFVREFGGELVTIDQTEGFP